MSVCDECLEDAAASGDLVPPTVEGILREGEEGRLLCASCVERKISEALGVDVEHIGGTMFKLKERQG